MSTLDDVLDDIAGRKQTLFELESAPENTKAAVVWTHQNFSILVQFGATPGQMYADVSCWQDGERTSLTVTDAMGTAIVQMNKEERV